MSKQQKPDLDQDLIGKALGSDQKSQRDQIEPVPRQRPKKQRVKPGRQPDYPDLSENQIKRVTVKLEESTYDGLRLALATTHKDKTQNTLVNEAIRAFLKLDKGKR